jgi:hypothetical protein
MEGRRALGLIFVIGGLALIGISVAGLLGGWGRPGSATSTAGPSAAPPASGLAEATPSLALPPPSPTAPISPTAPPITATPTEDVESVIRAFMARLETAVRDGAQESVAANLGGAVIDRYGVAACEAYLASREPSPEQRFEIVSITGPAPWDYVTDGRTTTVPNAYTLVSRVTGPNPSGEILTRDAELHVQLGDGMVFWFTDCGEPLATAP